MLHVDDADDAAGLREFSLRVVEALAGSVAAVKPQAAFYERHGSSNLEPGTSDRMLFYERTL